MQLDAQQPRDRREQQPENLLQRDVWNDELQNAVTIAISARNAISIAAIFRARCRPSPAPRAAASMILTPGFSTCTFTLPAVAGLSTSGIRIFASMMVAGAVMITAVSRCRISTCAINT